jgi:hypothetical protein
MLVRAVGARSVVEFGTSFGVSTLHLAAGLRDNGGGRIITTEFEPSKAARAQENFAVGGLADLIELREGDALQTLARDLPGQIDGFSTRSSPPRTRSCRTCLANFRRVRSRWCLRWKRGSSWRTARRTTPFFADSADRLRLRAGRTHTAQARSVLRTLRALTWSDYRVAPPRQAGLAGSGVGTIFAWRRAFGARAAPRC